MTTELGPYGLFIVEDQGFILGRGLTPEQAHAAMPQKQATRKWIEDSNGEMVPHGVELTDPDDFDTRRQKFYDAAKNQIAASYPMSHNGMRMDVSDLEYDGNEDTSPDAQKSALLGDKTLAKRLRGTVRLTDEATGKVMDEQRMSLMRVPHLTERGTMIHNGSEYTHIFQSRLVPGPYTRRQDNGALETHFSARPGTGKQFRVGLEPMTGQYRMRVGSSDLHLYSLLKDLGVEDSDLEKRWGKGLLELNRNKFDKKVLGKAYEKFVRPSDKIVDATDDNKREAVTSALNTMQINEAIARRNLPNLFDMRKAAAWRTEELPVFDPDIRPEEAMDSWLVENLPIASTKLASFRDDELRSVAAFIAQATGAPINLQGKNDEIELQVLQAIGQQPTPYNAAVMQAGVTAMDNVAKQASFNPDFDPDELLDVFNALHGKAGPQLASMKKWPEHWLHPQDPLGWLQWYEQYHAGRRTEDDERQIRRWAKFKARNTPRFVSRPSARMGFALRNWAIDPVKLIKDPADKKQLIKDMAEYKSKAKSEWEKEHGISA